MYWKRQCFIIGKKLQNIDLDLCNENSSVWLLIRSKVWLIKGPNVCDQGGWNAEDCRRLGEFVLLFKLTRMPHKTETTPIYPFAIAETISKQEGFRKHVLCYIAQFCDSPVLEAIDVSLQ